MKCPQCGYVSFDNLAACKNCGRSFESQGEKSASKGQEPRLQDELFALAAEEEQEAGPAVAGEDSEEAVQEPLLESVVEEAAEEEPVLVPEEDAEALVPEAEEMLTLEDGAEWPGEEEGTELVREDIPPASENGVSSPALLPEEEGGSAPGGHEEPPLETVDQPAQREEAQAGMNAGPEVAPPLPSMEIEFDPSSVVEEEEEKLPVEKEVAGQEDRAEPGTSQDPGVASEESTPEPIFDDDTELPEDLWVEESAGALPRLAAFAVDAGAILALLSLFFAGAVAALSVYGYGWQQLKTPAGIGALFVPFYLLGLFVSMCYYTFFPGWMGKTPGKAAMGLDIQRTDGGSMTYTRAFLRWAGYLVSLTFVGLGFLWILIDERKRGWHDYLSGTWVKNLRKEQLEGL
jgi:uncharacterized RDD family membrane protein YckC